MKRKKEKCISFLCNITFSVSGTSMFQSLFETSAECNQILIPKWNFLFFLLTNSSFLGRERERERKKIFSVFCSLAIICSFAYSQYLTFPTFTVCLVDENCIALLHTVYYLIFVLAILENLQSTLLPSG